MAGLSQGHVAPAWVEQKEPEPRDGEDGEKLNADPKLGDGVQQKAGELEALGADRQHAPEPKVVDAEREAVAELWVKGPEAEEEEVSGAAVPRDGGVGKEEEPQGDGVKPAVEPKDKGPGPGQDKDEGNDDGALHDEEEGGEEEEEDQAEEEEEDDDEEEEEEEEEEEDEDDEDEDFEDFRTDEDWEKELAADGAAYRWLSRDPKTRKIVPYPKEVEEVIEEAFQAGHHEVVFTVAGNDVRIAFQSMKQFNFRGGHRACWRYPKAERPTEPLDCSAARMAQRLGAIAAVDEIVARILARRPAGDDGAAPQAPAPPAPREGLNAALSGVDRECILEVYRHIQQGLRAAGPRRRYDFDPVCDEQICFLQVKHQVPAYYANLDTGQTIWCRKMLSVAGLANLILFGPIIFDQIAEKSFSALMADYNGSEGPHLMKYYTGNSVDLDTVVLRCSDGSVLKVINSQNKHKGLPQYRSCQEFGASQQAKEISIAAAGPLIEHFCQDFGLEDESARAARRLVFDPTDTEQKIPRAFSNKDRGKWPLWQYINEGVNSFHANVPVMPDVYGALIQAPWHLARAWCLIHTEIEAGAERDKWVEDFFEDAVADSCFNGKWKAIEEFCARLGKLGAITDKLGKLQMRHQADFSAIYTDSKLNEDEKNEKEAELLLKLCEEEHPTGRDSAGKERAITLEDCRAFVTDPGATI